MTVYQAQMIKDHEKALDPQKWETVMADTDEDAGINHLRRHIQEAPPPSIVWVYVSRDTDPKHKNGSPVLVRGFKIEILKEEKPMAIDERMKPILKAELEIFKRAWDEGHYGPTEFDTDQNDISRLKIKTFAEITPEAWLGKINRYSDDKGKPYLVKYEGQLVYNFEYHFIIPCFDQQLIDMIQERENAPYTGTTDDAKRIEAIAKRIEELGGFYLSWV
jgi:hypothetical protein